MLCAVYLTDRLHRKSRLAIEYSYRIQKTHPQTWIFWVHAYDAAKFEAEHRDIADKLELDGREVAGVNAPQLVYDWLRRGAIDRWLMIIDSADDERAFCTPRQHRQSAAPYGNKQTILAALLREYRNGSILITSRNIDVARKLTTTDRDIIK